MTMLVFGSVVANAYAQLAAHPVSATIAGSVLAFLGSWLLTRPRTDA